MQTSGKKHHNDPGRWTPPKPGWIKCNIDGAFYIHEDAGASGIILRDHTGRFVQGRATWRDYIADAMMMEVLALKEGLIIAKQRGFLKVCAETDCLTVV
jgi:ribonuclease HI